MAYASVIAGSAVIRGNVRGDTSLEILGRVEGDVGITGDLSIGPDAVIVGSVSAARVVVGGSVEGDVTGTDAVVVADTGRVVGDLVAPRIGMSEGAHVRGNVRTDGSNGSPARSAAPRAAASESRSAPVDRPRSTARGGGVTAAGGDACSEEGTSPASDPSATPGRASAQEARAPLSKEGSGVFAGSKTGAALAPRRIHALT